jgi:hypothetical protein
MGLEITWTDKLEIAFARAITEPARTKFKAVFFFVLEDPVGYHVNVPLVWIEFEVVSVSERHPTSNEFCLVHHKDITSFASLDSISTYAFLTLQVGHISGPAMP